MLQIDKSSPIPLHVQLKRALARLIEEGKLKPGDRIMSESELCEKYNISRITARRAIDDLAREGYLRKIPGKGTFVSAPKIVEKLGFLVTFTEDMLSRGLKPGSKLLKRDVIKPATDILECLQLSEGERAIYLERLLLANEEPICFQKVFLPLKIFAGFLAVDEKEVETKELCDVLNMFVPRPVVWARQALESVLITGKEAKLLGVPEGSPGLLCERTTFDEADNPVEYVEFLYRADRYKFMVNLARPGFAKISASETFLLRRIY